MLAFYEGLELHRSVVNRLNVYPVPDGDTGTNMALTLESVVKALDGLDLETADGGAMGAACRAIASGSLMGARGNSGVILCQILRGTRAPLLRAGRSERTRRPSPSRRAAPPHGRRSCDPWRARC